MSYINSIEHSIVITYIPYTEVTQVISTLKNSSDGWDKLPTFVAKKCISGYIEPLTYMINTSFTEGNTSVQISINDITYLVSSMNAELELLSRRFKANKLSRNAQTTFYLVFHRTRLKDHDLSIRIDGSTLTRSNNIKYLGVIIDHKLNWCEHIAHVKNKVSKEIGILYKARLFLNKKSQHNIYYSNIYPHLIYCIEGWGTACQTHLCPLFVVQRKL